MSRRRVRLAPDVCAALNEDSDHCGRLAAEYFAGLGGLCVACARRLSETGMLRLTDGRSVANASSVGGEAVYELAVDAQGRIEWVDEPRQPPPRPRWRWWLFCLGAWGQSIGWSWGTRLMGWAPLPGWFGATATNAPVHRAVAAAAEKAAAVGRVLHASVYCGCCGRWLGGGGGGVLGAVDPFAHGWSLHVGPSPPEGGLPSPWRCPACQDAVDDLPAEPPSARMDDPQASVEVGQAAQNTEKAQLRKDEKP